MEVFSTFSDDDILKSVVESYSVLSLIQFEAKNAFEVAMEEEQSDTEQPRTTTSWGRPSRDSLPKEVHYDEIGHNILRQEDGRRRRCRICFYMHFSLFMHKRHAPREDISKNIFNLVPAISDNLKHQSPDS
ncbi:hypothetical protein ILUMI_17966 [Ignelater luminosus]|uniref:Uncharacterized protein n=1 Tax=Ignelater luminosus TaxID=2038154 RepID=A0A8K0G4K7_IGNLU|nr:hypothetical protein ILUMI_17966 [Ignelater luminosus]